MIKKIIVSILCCFLLSPIYCLRAEEINESTKWVNKVLSHPNLTKENIKNKIAKYDLSPLFTQTNSSYIFGFIGPNFKRIHVHFAKVRKSESNPNQYEVVGKTKVRNNICDFKGTITITSVREQAKDKIINGILDRDEKVASNISVRGIAVSDIEFREKPNQKHVGIFKGKLTTNFYIDRNDIIHYDDLNNYSDSYYNNAFVGVWTSYNGKLTKKVHWGEWRVPFSGDLDIGAGEFWPNGKYLNNGWEFFSNHDNVIKKAPDGMGYNRQLESEWWNN